MNSSSLDGTLKSDISEGVTVRFQDFYNVVYGFLSVPVALYVRHDLLREWRWALCDGMGTGGPGHGGAFVAGTNRWMGWEEGCLRHMLSASSRRVQDPLESDGFGLRDSVCHGVWRRAIVLHERCVQAGIAALKPGDQMCKSCAVGFAG